MSNNAPHKILSVSYDEALLMTRQMMLEQAGYRVTSALGFSEGIEQCRACGYELVIIGHSIPRKDKSELIREAKKQCGCPVLSIRRHGDLPHPDADFSVDSLDGPQVLINEVNRAFGVPQNTSR
jgi:DNA-binding NtrC family response regulator